MENENIINANFDIPYYIFDAIVKYYESSKDGVYNQSKWEEVKLLLNLAVLNNRITTDQLNFIIETFHRG